MEKQIMTNANEVVKEELANKNSLDLTTTDSVAVSNRLKAIDTLGVAIKNNLIEGINEDYAVIPNTSKPALLLPGARKICLLYGIAAEYPIMEEDKEHNMITVKCILKYQGMNVAESYGAAMVGKQRDYGWEYNKALKIAQKRAFVGATLQIANLSKLFTQDTEDMQPVKEYTLEQKQNTYKVANQYYRDNKLPMSRAAFKDNWKKFCEAYGRFAEKNGLNANCYELGCDSQIADKFLQWNRNCEGLVQMQDMIIDGKNMSQITPEELQALKDAGKKGKK